MKAAAIILAAGESRRMGRPKALLPFRDGTFLSVLAGTLAEFCEPVVAVFGSNGQHMPAQCPAGVAGVVNPVSELGMITSLQVGLRARWRHPARVLFTLVDHPAVRADTVAQLLEYEAPVVIPRFSGKRGHPVLVSGAIASEYLAEPSTSKVRDVINRHEDEILYFDVEDPGITDDIDDPGLYEALLAREAK